MPSSSPKRKVSGDCLLRLYQHPSGFSRQKSLLDEDCPFGDGHRSGRRRQLSRDGGIVPTTVRAAIVSTSKIDPSKTSIDPAVETNTSIDPTVETATSIDPTVETATNTVIIDDVDLTATPHDNATSSRSIKSTESEQQSDCKDVTHRNLTSWLRAKVSDQDSSSTNPSG